MANSHNINTQENTSDCEILSCNLMSPTNDYFNLKSLQPNKEQTAKSFPMVRKRSQGEFCFN
ncbi:hypothetical protein, partial [Salmonella sp. s51228]|uniref:hypothetical protein n=1 Tax=Salmonella sp. s51228 TaxID=3159652 RepID=UPI0039818398